MTSVIDDYLKSIPNPPNIYPHQADIIDWLYSQWLKKQSSLVGDSMGLGKTMDICMFLELVKVRRAIIIVPTSTIYQWVRALLTNSRSYYVYVNTNNTIRQTMLSPDGHILHSRVAPMDVLNYEDGICKVTVCNYHSVNPFPGVTDQNGMTGHKFETSMKYDTYMPQLTPFNNIVWDLVVADEVHKIRNGVNTKLDSGSSRKKMLMFYRMMRLRMNPHHSLKVGLSGTPVQNRFSDVASILTWLGCPFPPRPTLDNLKQMLSIYMFRRTEHDLHPGLRKMIVFPDIQPIEYDIDVVYESQAEADVYRIVAGAIAGVTIPGGEHNPYSRVQYEDNPLVRTTYQRLLSADINQFILSHNKRYESMKLPWWTGKTSKITMIANKVEEFARENESVIIFHHFKEERDAIREKIWHKSQSYGMGPTFGCHEFIIDGDVQPEDREFILYESKRLIALGQRCIVYATMQSSAEGLNMQHFCKIIIASTDWNPANELQAIKRAHRIGQNRVVEVYRYIHRYWLDDKKHIDLRVEEKKDIKKAKSDELITGVFNAARTWRIREMPGFPDEPCVIFKDIYDDDIEETMRELGIMKIGQQSEDVRPSDRSYTQTLSGVSAGSRHYKKQDVGEMVSSMYLKAGQSTGIKGMISSQVSGQNTSTSTSNPFGHPTTENVPSIFNTTVGNRLDYTSSSSNTSGPLVSSAVFDYSISDINQQYLDDERVALELHRLINGDSDVHEEIQEQKVQFKPQIEEQKVKVQVQVQDKPQGIKFFNQLQRQPGTENLPIHLAREPVLERPTIVIPQGTSSVHNRQLTKEEIREQSLNMYKS